MQDAGARTRINKRAFEQYYKIALKRHGSQRRVAAEAGVSHTLIGQILNQRHKTHVNPETAAAFERVFDVPGQIVFMPELSRVTRKPDDVTRTAA